MNKLDLTQTLFRLIDEMLDVDKVAIGEDGHILVIIGNKAFGISVWEESELADWLETFERI